MATRKLVRRIPVEVKPITLGCYTLTATGLTVRGRPSFDEHEGVGHFIERTHYASGFWLADWLRYGEGRTDWTERLSQAGGSTGLSEKTLKNVRAIGAIDPSRRRDDVEFSIHAEVASLEPGEQTEWLERAATEGWGARELRQNIRAAKRPRIIEGQAVLEGVFRVLLVDCPWQYGDSGVINGTAYGKAERHYPTMSIDDLCRLPVASHTMTDAVMFFWVTSPFLMLKPGPREVIEAWGFEYKTGMVWHKARHNFGHYVSVRHEHLLICTRGSCLPDAPTPQPSSVFTSAKPLGELQHSEKPPEARQIIEKLYTQGPYLELFARQPDPRGKWVAWGNDPRLWPVDQENHEALIRA